MPQPTSTVLPETPAPSPVPEVPSQGRSLVVVSNRLPFTAERRPDGIRFTRSAGGLVAALGAIWLVEVAGAPAGYCVLGSAFSLEFHGRIAFVDELYLREEFRGRGHGARLLALLEEECRARGLRAMRLEVERSNRRARSLYERAGFVRHDRFIMTKWLQRGSG